MTTRVRYARQQQHHHTLKTLLASLEHGVVGTLTSISSIAEDRALSDAEKVTRIRAVLATHDTRIGLADDPVATLKASLVSALGEDDYYTILEATSLWIQNRVSPILKALTFESASGGQSLVEALTAY